MLIFLYCIKFLLYVKMSATPGPILVSFLSHLFVFVQLTENLVELLLAKVPLGSP